MTTTLDLGVSAVRGSFEELEAQIRRCDNGEGMLCSDLDERIDHYVKLCENLREYINRWARAVFTGQVEFDQETEAIFERQIQLLLHHSFQVAAHGRQMDGFCYDLQGLNPLHHHMADLYYLRENWVSPRLAISPAPRVRLPHAAEQEIAERLETLSPLPANYRPSDPEQRAFFQKRRTK